MLIRMIRHGMTEGNRHARYIGRTDEPLTPEGSERVSEKKNALCFQSEEQQEKVWIVSPLLRCIQTAAILSAGNKNVCLSGNRETDLTILNNNPGMKYLYIDDELRECDFGTFEGKNYLEMQGDVSYQKWIDSGGTMAFPGGEDPEKFKERCCSAFLRWMDRLQNEECFTDVSEVNFVVHGGTIMSVMDRFALDENGSSKEYYDWHVKNAEGFEWEVDRKDLHTFRQMKRVVRHWA